MRGGAGGTVGSRLALGWEAAGGGDGGGGHRHSLSLAESVNRALVMDPARIRLPDLDSIIEILQVRFPSQARFITLQKSVPRC